MTVSRKVLPCGRVAALDICKLPETVIELPAGTVMGGSNKVSNGAEASEVVVV